MLDFKSTLWRRGLVIDLYSGLRHSWALLISLPLVLLAIDLALGWALAPDRSSPRFDDAKLESAADLRAWVASTAEEARATPDAPMWLLVGDSVLAGDVLQGRIADWDRRRVVDYLRDERSPGFSDRFRQVALNGLLPVDLARVVRQLDREDPEGRVGLVVEINPRFFSRLYARQTACTRPWLKEVAPSLLAGGSGDAARIDRLSAALHAAALASDWVAAHAPIFRHLDRLPPLPKIPEASEFVVAAKPGDSPADVGGESAVSRGPEAATEDRLAGLARILEHYRDPDLSESSTQVAALRETVERVRATGRPAYFFVTPLEDSFQKEAMSRAEYGAYQAALADLIEGVRPSSSMSPASPPVSVSVERPSDPSGTSALSDLDASASPRLLQLDDPLFAPQLFVDHCHMLPEGNRRLALNLLHEMGIGLARLPATNELVFPEAIDHSMVWDREQGHADGSGTNALFQRPEGVAIGPGGRIVVADTGNHCLREWSDGRQTVRTVAGIPGRDGTTDGPSREALLDRPRAPRFHGEAVFFTDGGDRRVRRFEGGAVATEYVLDGPVWTSPRMLRSFGRELFVLDGTERVLAFDPVTRRARVQVLADGAEKIAAFEIAPDGRLFVATTSSRIWRGVVGPPLALVPPGADPEPPLRIGSDGGMSLWFANEGRDLRDRDYDFPHELSRLRCDRILDLQFVPSYDGVLLQIEEVITNKSTLSGTFETVGETIADRIHLRFLRCADDLVYPWIKTNVYSKYALENNQIHSWVSPLHVGSMALDPATNALHYLEKLRSRAYRLEDGLIAAAKDGNGMTGGGIVVEPGAKGAERILTEIGPQSRTPARLERVPRRGPWTGLLLGSSIMGVSDMVGYYSCARRIELELRDRFGLLDGERIDLIAQILYGMKILQSVEAFESLVERGVKLDFVLIEIFNEEHQNVWLVAERLPGANAADRRDGAYEYLERVAAAAARYGTKVVFLDNSALFNQPGEGLELPTQMVRDFLDSIRAAGFDVIDVAAPSMRDHLEVYPWGSPPYLGWHASPWAIDTTGRLFADRLYPLLRKSFEGRVPAVLLPEAAPLETPGEMLAKALEPPALPAGAGGMERIPDRALHVAYANRELRVFVDLSGVDSWKADPSDATLDRIALSVLRRFLQGPGAERRATRATLTLALFTNYDEYGQGVRDSASARFQRSFDRESLSAWLVESNVAAGLSAPRP